MQCHSARTQSTDDGKTADALRAAFQEASRYAPCILMLQQVELLAAAKGASVQPGLSVSHVIGIIANSQSSQGKAIQRVHPSVCADSMHCHHLVVLQAVHSGYTDEGGGTHHAIGNAFPRLSKVPEGSARMALMKARW